MEKLYRGHRSWLTAAINHSIPWPENDVVVRYDGNDYFLRGLKPQKDKLEAACITVRLNTEKDLHSTLKRIYTFTSILGWFKGGYVDVTGHMTASAPARYSAGRQPYAPITVSGPYGFNCNFLPVVNDENTRKALAFWREGLRLEEIHDGYSFLSFYKVIESQFKPGKHKGSWIDGAIPTLTGQAGNRVKELKRNVTDLGKHIYHSGRCAVAHASLNGTLVDPDIPDDRIRIAQDLIVIKGLAEKFIREELGVPDELEVHRHRDALSPLYKYVDQRNSEALRSGEAVSPEDLGLNALRVSVNHWAHEPPSVFQNLILSVVSVQNGLVDLRARNEAGTLSLAFLFNFPDRKAHTAIERSGVQSVAQGGRQEEEIAFLEYEKAVLGNDVIELQMPDSEKIVCEIVIPVNVDIDRTCEAIDRRIAEIRSGGIS